jgi:two-component system, LytTR family, response regulator
VFIQDGTKSWFISMQKIRLLEVTGDYTRIYFDENQPLIHRTANALEQRLPASLFFRANRKHIVNLAFVESVQPCFGHCVKLTLRGGEEVELSRRSTKAFRKQLSL